MGFATDGHLWTTGGPPPANNVAGGPLARHPCGGPPPATGGIRWWATGGPPSAYVAVWVIANQTHITEHTDQSHHQLTDQEYTNIQYRGYAVLANISIFTC